MAADAVMGYEIMRRFAAVMFDRLQAGRARLSTSPSDIALPEASVAGPWAGLRATVSALR